MAMAIAADLNRQQLAAAARNVAGKTDAGGRQRTDPCRGEVGMAAAAYLHRQCFVAGANRPDFGGEDGIGGMAGSGFDRKQAVAGVRPADTAGEADREVAL